MVISHNVDLLADVVNRVWFLDAVRGEVDVYNMGWQKYLDARATDEQRRRRERANAERKASALRTQAAKMGAKATKAVAAQNMLRRADRMMAALDEERVADKVARIKFPTPAPCGRTPLVAKGLTQDLRIAGGVHRRRPGHRPGFAGRGARPQRRGQDHAAATAGRRRDARRRAGSNPATACKIGYFAQEHDTLDDAATVWENIRHAAPDTGEQDLRGLLGRVHVQRSAARPAGGHAVRR